ncbi:MAG: triose-phosphate isomerase [Planctomycetales bacterium]|nr:triose-phosphate isomerase [Planctomycetales bacterium]
MARPLIAGNWKMNLRLSEAISLAEAVRREAEKADGPDLLLCPPFPFLAAVGEALRGSRVALGAQTLHPEPKGAYTGEVAGEMLAEVGCRFAIVGHSERRQHFREDNAAVAARVRAAHRARLAALVCVGETLPEREEGRTLEVVERQAGAALEAHPSDVASVTVAYEPVWAIGTGRIATVEQAAEAHQAIRRLVRETRPSARDVRVLYGGSVTPDTAPALLAHPEVDGALVGGASLKADSFLAIVRAVPKARLGRSA